MPILRHEHVNNFTIVPNELLRDPGLSLRDVGLLCVMLSLPDEWAFSIKGLEKIFPHDGRDAICKSLRRIESAGYLHRDRQRDKTGKIGPVIWLVSDVPGPCTDLPDTAQPDAVLPDTVNPPQRKNPMNKKPNTKGQDHAPAKHTRKSFGEYGWIHLTDDEHRKLLCDLGEVELNRCITYIDESAQTTGNKNHWKDWNLVLRRCSREKWGPRIGLELTHQEDLIEASKRRFYGEEGEPC